MLVGTRLLVRSEINFDFQTLKSQISDRRNHHPPPHTHFQKLQVTLCQCKTSTFVCTFRIEVIVNNNNIITCGGFLNGLFNIHCQLSYICNKPNDV